MTMNHIDREQYIYGVRAVIEAIEAGKEIDKIYVSRDARSELVDELLAKAREAHLLVARVPVQRIDRITRKNHQGVVALLAAVTYYSLDQLVPMLYDNGDNPLIVVLDGITDVRNFGAIARTCECAGVNAIVIPDALNVLPVCRERDVVGAVRYPRDCGFKIVGTAGQANMFHVEADYTVPVAIVLGAEDTGISPQVMRLCDTQVRIPEFGQINSLNVSVAAGVMIYEVVRQRLNDNQQVS